MSRVLVGTLSIRARKRDAESFLREFEGLTLLSLQDGDGYVEFDNFEDATKFLEMSKGKTLNGESCSVSLESEKSQWPLVRTGGSRGRRTGITTHGLRYVQTGHRVVVENLTGRTNWKDLKDYFRKAGDVTYADVHKKGLGIGVVEFSTRFGVNKAIRTLNETFLNGRKIRVVNEKVYNYKALTPLKKSPMKRSHSQSSTRSPSPNRKQRGTHPYFLRRHPPSSFPKSGNSVLKKAKAIKARATNYRLASRTSWRHVHHSSTLRKDARFISASKKRSS